MFNSFFSVYWVDAFLVGWMVHSSMTKSFFSFSDVIFFSASGATMKIYYRSVFEIVLFKLYSVFFLLFIF